MVVAIHDDVDASSAVGSRLRPTWQSGQGGSCRARQLRAQFVHRRLSSAEVASTSILSHVPLCEYGLLTCYHFHIGDFRD